MTPLLDRSSLSDHGITMSHRRVLERRHIAFSFLHQASRFQTISSPLQENHIMRQSHTSPKRAMRLALLAFASALTCSVALANDQAGPPPDKSTSSPAPVRTEATLPQPEQYGRAGDERLREQMQSNVHPLSSVWSDRQSATVSEPGSPMPPKDAGRAGDASWMDEMR